METTQFKTAADNLRVLIAAMVEKAHSGHPGGAMGAADFMTVLYGRHIVYDPADPKWIARDRFFLDPGHMSTMLYGILAMTGRYTTDELQQFRQWGSVTPGHPELDPARGVENSSGPLGQGHVMAVGCAIAERFLVARFGQTLAHKTYAFISDGGIQEEISQGAGRLAGYLGLSNLIMFYDSNKVQLSTTTSAVTHEDTAAKYRAWNWNVIEVDGSDVEQIDRALEQAKAETKRPTLIIGHTIMARGAVKADGTSLEGAVSTHGQPLTAAGADWDATVRNLGGDPANAFVIRDSVKALFADRRDQLKTIAAERHADEKAWAEANMGLAIELENWINGILPQIDYTAIEYGSNEASRNSSAKVLGVLAERVGNMIVSSADLANSDKTDGFLKKTRAFTPDDFGGKFLQAGVAELTMASVMNGIALHGGLIAACGTFFVFSDYIKPALRMSALMELPVKYIFTHDAFRVGEDGPTHEPVEHEAQMRLMEMLNNLHGRQSTLVIRPADSAETMVAWKMAMENKQSPTVLILSRQNLEDLPALEGDRRHEALQAEHGGYIIHPAQTPDVVLLANGSEVSLALHAAALLEADGYRVQVDSFPSMGVFLRQNEEYKRSVLPPDIPRFGITAGLPAALYPLMKGTSQWDVFGLERFGASAPYKVLDEKFGFTDQNVYELIKRFLENE